MLDRLQGKAASVSVSFVDANAFPHPALLDYLVAEHGDAFRLAVARDGDDSAAVVASEVGEAEVYVSLDPETDVALRSFVESCRGRLH